MKVEIRSVADKGLRLKERLVLKARAETDIGEYVLMQAGFDHGAVTVGTHHTLWFPYKKVRAGDLIVVYTKEGTEMEKRLKDGSTAHFFYWGISEPIWNTSNRAPVILYAPEWSSKNPDEL